MKRLSLAATLLIAALTAGCGGNTAAPPSADLADPPAGTMKPVALRLPPIPEGEELTSVRIAYYARIRAAYSELADSHRALQTYVQIIRTPR